MKIRCKECGTRFRYESNSGICPKCMEFNPWTETSPVPGYSSGHRFFLWAAGFMAVSFLVMSPILYQAHKEKQMELDQYAGELEAESGEAYTQEVPQGEPVRAGEYYVTPATGFWLPGLYTVGLTDNENRILVVPLTVIENLDSPKDRRIEFRLESNGETVYSSSLQYSAEDYWPGLKGYLLHYSFWMEPDGEQQYLVFETEGKPEELILCVEESILQPDTYETTITKIYKTPLDVAPEEGLPGKDEPGGEERQLFMGYAVPSVKKVEMGDVFDYYGERLAVTGLQCATEEDGITVPEGKKLVAAAVRRESAHWPGTDSIRAFTAMADREGNVAPNERDWEWERWLDTDLSDLWGYFYDYTYESGSGKQEERENPDTVYQCYLVDEDASEMEIIFPGVTRNENEMEDTVPGGSEDDSAGYWQIRIPVKIPSSGQESGKNAPAPLERRMRR